MNKEFSYETTSGSIRLPASTAGAGRCAVKTVSGDVDLSIAAN